jgi:hypothetical protein
MRLHHPKDGIVVPGRCRPGYVPHMTQWNLMSRSMIGLLQLMLKVFILAYAEFGWANNDRGRAFFRLRAACHGNQGEGRFDLGAPAVAGLQEWSGIKQDLPPADETIRVIGHQWSWCFRHPGVDRHRAPLMTSRPSMNCTSRRARSTISTLRPQMSCIAFPSPPST